MASCRGHGVKIEREGIRPIDRKTERNSEAETETDRETARQRDSETERQCLLSITQEFSTNTRLRDNQRGSPTTTAAAPATNCLILKNHYHNQHTGQKKCFTHQHKKGRQAKKTRSVACVLRWKPRPGGGAGWVCGRSARRTKAAKKTTQKKKGRHHSNRARQTN